MREFFGRRRRVLVAAGVSAAVLLGGGAAYAASGSGASGASAGSGSSAGSAAAGDGSAADGSAAATKPKADKDIPAHAVFGKVTAVSAPAASASSAGTGSGSAGGGRASGGGRNLANAGSITLSEPDGSTYTAIVLPRTKVFEYVAPGTKPVAEDLSAVKAGDEVGLYVRSPKPKGSDAGTAPSPTVAPVHIATRILDLTGSVPAPTTSSS